MKGAYDRSAALRKADTVPKSPTPYTSAEQPDAQPQLIDRLRPNTTFQSKAADQTYVGSFISPHLRLKIWGTDHWCYIKEETTTGGGNVCRTPIAAIFEVERIEDILNGSEDTWQPDPNNGCVRYKKVRIWRTSGVSK
jgi:hypothetical protein